MAMLEGQVDAVIGVDTHRDSHTAAVWTRPAGCVATPPCRPPAPGTGSCSAGAAAGAGPPGVGGGGHRQLRAGLTSLWSTRRVGGRGRPAQAAARRNGAKSDALDADRAAREALAREHLASRAPAGDREALRVLLATRRCVVDARTKAINQLKALIVTAPRGTAGAASPPRHRRHRSAAVRGCVHAPTHRSIG